MVTQIRTKEKDSYDAIQLGFEEKKLKHASKAEQNHDEVFAKCSHGESPDFALGQPLD